MTPDDAAKVLVQTARQQIRFTVSNTMQLLRTGMPREFINPFTGNASAHWSSPEGRLVAERFESCGLRKDAAFLDAFEKMLLDRVLAPVFGLFAAFDGEGCFVGNASFDIRTSDGTVVAGYLHE